MAHQTPPIRHVLLTGKPGIGKTTLVKHVCARLSEKNIGLNGFFTEEIRDCNVRVGFDIVSFDGGRGPLARANQNVKGAPKVGKYCVDVQSFESIALPVFKTSSSVSKTVLVIDEIGRMEMFSPQFVRQVKEAFNTTNTILATIPVTNNPLVQQLRSHKSAQVFEVNYDNRNTLHVQVLDTIITSLNM